MTQTSNIGLKKIDGSENWRQIFDYHNDSADKTDGAVAAVQDGLAIVANGNTHAAVAEGQFVYVRNHSTLAEGLYKASAAIGTNATLSTSNLTADGSGGLNDLQEQVTSLNSKLAPLQLTVTLQSGWSLKSWGHATAIKTGNIVVVTISGLISDADTSGDVGFAQITGLSPKDFVLSVGKTDYQAGLITLSAHAGETNLYISNAHANQNNFGQLVIPVDN